MLTMSVSVFAGDIISPLMEDDGQIYFGEVMELTDNTVTIIQKKNVKGEFKQNSEHKYERKDFTARKDLETGKIYLCTAFNGDNFMIWEVTSTDTKTLEVIGNDTFAGQMQQYLNEGLFEKAEKERLVQNEQSAQHDTSSTVVIGGADEPTDIMVKSNNSIWIIVGTGVFILVLITLFVKRKRKNN